VVHELQGPEGATGSTVWGRAAATRVHHAKDSSGEHKGALVAELLIFTLTNEVDLLGIKKHIDQHINSNSSPFSLLSRSIF
jgi:hypothetical protein